jgi:hypothetical protein
MVVEARATTLTGELVAWLIDERDWVDEQLNRCGAILLRGFSVRTPAEFTRVTAVLGSRTFLHCSVEPLGAGRGLPIVDVRGAASAMSISARLTRQVLIRWRAGDIMVVDHQRVQVCTPPQKPGFVAVCAAQQFVTAADTV